MILVDTSALIELVRDTNSPMCNAVDRLLDDDLATCDAISMALLAGARDERQLSQLRGLLARTTMLPTTDFELAAALFRACRRSGETVRRLIDCLLGAVAVRADVEILHADADFEVLARHTDARAHRDHSADHRSGRCTAGRRDSESNSLTLMADSDIKALTEDLSAPDFETTAFTTPPPLSEATVAIVTTASLHHPDQDDFAPMDTSYRVLDGSRRDYAIGHWSPNFDDVGFAYDMNTVFPLDRLDELEARGVIGRVADRHMAYAGNQVDLSTIEMDTGPAGATWLREQGVDVVLLTPV